MMPTSESDNESRDGHRVECAVDLPVAAGEGFDLWLRLETLPDILDGVRRVKCIGHDRVLWEVDIGGRQVLWEAELTDVQPGRRIAWKSRSGAPNRGTLSFEPIAPNATRMTVEIVYETRGWLERLGARLGLAQRLVQRSIEADLGRFRRFVQDRMNRRQNAALA